MRGVVLLVVWNARHNNYNWPKTNGKEMRKKRREKTHTHTPKIIHTHLYNRIDRWHTNKCIKISDPFQTTKNESKEENNQISFPVVCFLSF